MIREIRDPVHGFIYRTSLEETIIDTGIFQRLRSIKQLAMASLVYPGALHTRFEHSLGVMHLAGKLCQQLLTDQDGIEQTRIVRLAALLHDIGHGPFSHVSESVLEVFYDREKIKPKATEKIHELLTEKVTGYSAVSKKGFEVKRFDYELTEDGNIVANAICARDKEQATEIQNCLERLNKAGELDYVELSIAAKAIFILQDGHKPMSPGEIAEQAKRFKWDISREAVDGAVEFLSRLGLVS